MAALVAPFFLCQILISNWFPHSPFARHSDLKKGDLCDQTKLRSTGGEGGHTTGMGRGGEGSQAAGKNNAQADSMRITKGGPSLSFSVLKSEKISTSSLVGK